MKKSYISPQMTIHGSVEQLTQVIGEQATQDVLIFNGETLGTDTQSQSFDL
ncbi:MAG: lasso peptide [Cyanobacteria bacterium P01_F01_bin.86]